MLSRRFRVPAEPIFVTTTDGVTLRGSRLGTGHPAVVLCHGFLGWHRKPRAARLADWLAGRFSVYAFDHRGHGQSDGVCTFGDREIEDVSAVVARAREDGHTRVMTVGTSMGGIAAIRHAALVGGVDGVVAISAPARWEGHESAAARRVRWLSSTSRGRRLGRALGVRLSDTWGEPEPPEDVVGRIAPIPLVIVHGHDDHFFEEEEAWRLYRRAGHPKRLLLAGRFGHAEDGFTEQFADRLAGEIAAMDRAA
jgi:pimeloyl-ACP methyl ester carboxylesterase